ncbi:glycosyltransferase family 2 protein [Litchfieldia salsa]|uniref:Rhamnosyltransferase n=1 Tax=Litchfieldia salsa TaxID=930152 RepID=A0A1H0WVZ2_9BACI|nr:glycosyltransferase family 2 protein [Litchfieldia salsa]SDP94883.1 rhamnosyltransferase [Litchfieldia salsa]
MSNKIRVYAVMVCYNPNISELIHHTSSIIQQVEKLIVVDNSENPVNNGLIEEIKNHSSIQWIALNKNEGIGFAQNVGIREALREDAEFILLLDQDSNPPSTLVEELSKGILFLKSKGVKVGCMGPEVFNKESSEVYTPLLNKGAMEFQNFNERDALISSGTLIPSESLETVGLMEEELFIDLVDFEWCWRAKESGYRSFVTRNVRMGHMVGQKNTKILGVYNLLIPSPLRHYYQFRNSIFLFTRSYVPLYWKVRVIVERMIDLVAYPLLVGPRAKRLHYILKGIIHGISGKKGSITKW